MISSQSIKVYNSILDYNKNEWQKFVTSHIIIAPEHGQSFKENS